MEFVNMIAAFGGACILVPCLMAMADSAFSRKGRTGQVVEIDGRLTLVEDPTEEV